eukprot:UC1_evm1s2153
MVANSAKAVHTTTQSTKHRQSQMRVWALEHKLRVDRGFALMVIVLTLALGLHWSGMGLAVVKMVIARNAAYQIDEIYSILDSSGSVVDGKQFSATAATAATAVSTTTTAADLPWAEFGASIVVATFCVTLTILPICVFASVALMYSYVESDQFHQRVPLTLRAAGELCGAWFVWNVHLITYALFLLPLALTPGLSHCQALRHYFIYVFCVTSPIIVGTGMAKVAVRRLFGCPFGSRQRALLGLCCGTAAVYHLQLEALYPRDSPAFYTVAGMMACHYTYCAVTFYDEPEFNGRRFWPLVLKHHKIWRPAIDYMGMQVVFDAMDDNRQKNKDDDGGGGGGGKDENSTAASMLPPPPPPPAVLPAGRPYIMGYHPHGIIPFAAGLLLVHPEWKRLAPGVTPHFMVDALLQAIPGIRDILQWFGSKEVSRDSVASTLAAEEPLLLVPGGQVEMMRSRSWVPETYISASHRGFVRMAVSNGAPLLPIVSIGEQLLMDNIYCPSLQIPCYKVLGFPFPFVPYGRFGLPFPRRKRKGITVVVGHPLEVCKVAPGSQAHELAVSRLHRRYFEELRSLYNRHKTAAGYPDRRVVITDLYSDDKTKGRRGEK